MLDLKQGSLGLPVEEVGASQRPEHLKAGLGQAESLYIHLLF